jgi:UDP-glucose 4-epimerase
LEIGKLRVVITGGAGFIGSNLAKQLYDDGHDVLVIDNLRSGYRKNLLGLKNVTFIEGSITNEKMVKEELKGKDYVFNFAALVSVPESLEKPEECVDINVKGLLNLLKYSKEYELKKFVQVSSAAVYGENPIIPKKVKMIPDPKTPYAVTKLDGEYYCNIYNDAFGLKTISLRFFNVYGPKQDPKSQYAAAIPIFIYRALKGEDIIIYGDGEQTRDFIFIDDVISALKLAVQKENINGVFNVANENSISINRLAKEVISLTGSKSKILYEKERPGDIKHSLASITETKEILGFEPKIVLRDGLKKTIEFFKAEKT